MTDPTTVFTVGMVLAIAMGVAVLLLWRLRTHVARRTEAEARMAAAMQELQLLSARLQAQRAAMARRDAAPDDAPPET
jgi:type II secretory pathway pseudopilin PulG